MNLKRVYRRYSDWEEVQFNMWGEVNDQQDALDKAIAFTSDHKKYGQYMMRVVNEWPVSCENALTDQNLNRRAWVGHAACALALGIPEDITRKAWGHLTDEQRILANREAARAIRTWEKSHTKNKGLRQNMERPMLF